jgi:heme exporter protein C
MQFIKNHWWKILAVALLSYVLMAGLLLPLEVGVVTVTPSSAKAGQPLRLMVQGYNTFFTQETPRLWLKPEGEPQFLAADSVRVTNDRELVAFFALQGNFAATKKVVTTTLVLDSKRDGTRLLPSAVFVTQNDSLKTALATVGKPTDLSGDQPGKHYPYREILEESIRNLYFHVPLWFGMLLLFLVSGVYSARHLVTKRVTDDLAAKSFAIVGMLYAILGTTTGMLWAKYTWGQAWSWDVKQIGTAASLAIYCAYFVLRGAFDEDDKRARISAVYNIFAFAMLIPLLFVLPRMTDSLHPGNGGNPAFSKFDLNINMRFVFYPAVVGWMLLGVWIATLLKRVEVITAKRLDIL